MTARGKAVPLQIRPTITDNLLRADANNLTLVRLVLASAVIWTHSYWLVSGQSGYDELAPWLGTPISQIAVDGFFFLSGFLVYASLIRRPSVPNFFLARFARIWPGLTVAVVLTVLIGALATSAAPAGYWRGETLSFLTRNPSLLTSDYFLTGVTCVVDPCVVNGSLWTIPWEIRCYLALGLLGALGFAKPQIMARLILPATALGALLWHWPGLSDLLRVTLGDGMLFNLDLAERLWTMFALGIAAFVWRDRIGLSWLVLAGLLALTLAEAHWGLNLHIRSLFTGYAVLCCGFLTARRGSLSGRWPDYSYGMYIYAFPVMIVAGSLYAFDTHPALALVTFLLTLPLAALSWHFVEHPALSLVRKRGKRVSPPMPLKQQSDAG